MSELVDLALRHARTAGIHATQIAGLSVMRTDTRTPKLYQLFKPALCYVVQGAKEVAVGSDILRYRAGQFLFSSVELPLTGEVLDAKPAKPYLCLALEIDPAMVFELVSATDKIDRTRAPAGRAIFVGSDDTLGDAFLRLMRCLRSPADAAVLAPTIVREITYRLLRGSYGAVVRELGIANSQTQRIATVIERLKRDYAKPLRTEDLARLAGMSVSAFHAHFKKVTALSPLQYQKQMRLNEARRILLASPTSAAGAGFAVGYESATQFNREYTRFFGKSPIADTRRA
ncbi:MAG: AraC family transcriptional regulator [Kofleriaceae bacterium]